VESLAALEYPCTRTLPACGFHPGNGGRRRQERFWKAQVKPIAKKYLYNPKKVLS
jgi:hypothetical protein